MVKLMIINYSLEREVWSGWLRNVLICLVMFSGTDPKCLSALNTDTVGS